MNEELQLNIASLKEVATALLDGSISTELAAQLIYDRTIDMEIAMVTEPKTYTLDFETWCEENSEELTELFNETGMSREMDFDPEAEQDRIFFTTDPAKYPSLVWHITLEA